MLQWVHYDLEGAQSGATQFDVGPQLLLNELVIPSYNPSRVPVHVKWGSDVYKSKGDIIRRSSKSDMYYRRMVHYETFRFYLSSKSLFKLQNVPNRLVEKEFASTRTKRTYWGTPTEDNINTLKRSMKRRLSALVDHSSLGEEMDPWSKGGA